MQLTALQTAVKNYFTTGLASTLTATKPNEGSKTLAQWLAIGASDIIEPALNTPGYGGLGLQAAAGNVDSAAVRSAIMSGSDFLNIADNVMGKLNWAITADPFPFDNLQLVTNVQALLEAYPSSLAKFNALTVRPASINEAVFGGQVTMEDLNAIFGFFAAGG